MFRDVEPDDRRRPNTADDAATANGSDAKSFISGIVAKLNSYLGLASEEDDADETPSADSKRARAAAGAGPRRPAEPRAAVVPPPVRPEPAPGMAGQRWKTRTNPWLSVRGVGAAQAPPRTSTLPTRPAGRAGAPGRTAIQTCAPSRRAKAVAIHTPAVIPMSALRAATTPRSSRFDGYDMYRAAWDARALRVGTSRYDRTNPTSPPTRLRGVVAPPRAGQTAPIRHTTRSRVSATAARPPRTSREPSRAPNAGVDHGRHAGPPRRILGV